MPIKTYPDFRPITLSMRSLLHPALADLPDGVSEFTFAGLYLFRNSYDYHVAWVPGEQKLVLRGTKNGELFYAFPQGLPSDPLVRAAMQTDVVYFKNLSASSLALARDWARDEGVQLWEDRDNFDYVYGRLELAQLEGKKYHKKRNHVNAFLNSYGHEDEPFSGSAPRDAYSVLDAWHEERGRDDDYLASKEALDLCGELDQVGYMVRVDGQPAAYAMGEALQAGRSFVVHIEKGVSTFRGVYQYVNMAFCAWLPPAYQWINREQDLGNPGLRQAKMTYHPQAFVEKFRLYPAYASLPRVETPESQALMAAEA